MNTKEIALLAAEAGIDKKGLEPVLLEVSDQSSYTDYILIFSGRSDRHVQTIADGIAHTLRDAGVRSLGSEGRKDSHWALLDFGDLVVHVFYHPVREHYDLEGLWSEAPRIPLSVPPDSRISVAEAYSM